MNKLFYALVSAALLFCSTVAHASVYKLDFSATGFGPGIFSHLAAPQSPVTGSITFTAASLGGAVTSIDAIDLVIGGHAYTPVEIGTRTYGDGYVFGANGVGVNVAGTDDFYLILSTTLDMLSYSQNGILDTWVTRNVAATFTDQAVAGVPEPGSAFLLMAGFAGLCLLRRRRAH